MFQENRNQLEKALKPQVGQEPHIVIGLNEDGKVMSLFVVGDNTNVCQSADVKSCILHLLALYHVIKINYPPQYAQFLGFLQMHCLEIDFPRSLRSDSFVRLSSSICKNRESCS
jgi:hypothetical protein